MVVLLHWYFCTVAFGGATGSRQLVKTQSGTPLEAALQYHHQSEMRLRCNLGPPWAQSYRALLSHLPPITPNINCTLLHILIRTLCSSSPPLVGSDNGFEGRREGTYWVAAANIDYCGCTTRHCRALQGTRGYTSHFHITR